MISTAGSDCEKRPFSDDRRLWSLWDIVKKFDGAAFGAYSFIVATRNKWALEHMAAQNYSEQTLAILRDRASTLAVTFREVGLTVFAEAAEGLLREIDNTIRLPGGNRQFTNQNYGSAMGHLNVLAEYLGHEMRGRYLLMMSPNRTQYYEQPALFGEEIVSHGVV